MRISDWSSDVCSSDLAAQIVIGHVRAPGFLGLFILGAKLDFRFGRDLDDALWRSGDDGQPHFLQRIGRSVQHLAKLRRQVAPVHTLLAGGRNDIARSEVHTSELQSLMRTSYAVFCLKNKK